MLLSTFKGIATDDVIVLLLQRSLTYNILLRSNDIIVHVQIHVNIIYNIINITYYYMAK